MINLVIAIISILVCFTITIFNVLYTKKIMGSNKVKPEILKNNRIIAKLSPLIKERTDDCIKIIHDFIQEPDRSGVRKAAIFFIAIGSNLATVIFKCFREDEIELFTFEIARIDYVSYEEKEAVLQEFYELLTKYKPGLTGGIDYIRDVLEKSCGTQKAVDIICRLTSCLQVRPFDFIRRTDPMLLINFIKQEHNQIIALVLSYLEPEKASVILQNLPDEIQSDVTRRISCMDGVSAEVLREIERVLEKNLSAFSCDDYCSSGGIEGTVEILNFTDEGTKKKIIDDIKIDDPTMAAEIEKNINLPKDNIDSITI